MGLSLIVDPYACQQYEDLDCRNIVLTATRSNSRPYPIKILQRKFYTLIFIAPAPGLKIQDRDYPSRLRLIMEQSSTKQSHLIKSRE